MAKKKTTKAIDASTEEKIKIAARTVFQSKGYAAARTRDIAEEAGINLALLNYYFRSKEKLFEIIMLETITGFYQSVSIVFNDESSSFMEKLELLVTKYINFLLKEENIPIFILSEIRNRPEELFEKVPFKETFFKSVFCRQFNEEVAKGNITEPNPVQFTINILGLLVFPFLAKPFLQIIGGMNDADYKRLMQERKKLIPLWIKALMKTKCKN
jgi:AcrR family transcriptional regulator